MRNLNQSELIRKCWDILEHHGRVEDGCILTVSINDRQDYPGSNLGRRYTAHYGDPDIVEPIADVIGSSQQDLLMNFESAVLRSLDPYIAGARPVTVHFKTNPHAEGSI